MTSRRALLAALALAAALIGSRTDLAASPKDPGADLAIVRAHLQRLSGGPHPSGTAAATEVARYLTATLQRLGCEVRVPEGEGRSTAAATSGWVRNVVGVVPATGPRGAGRDAVLLCAHYDSTPDGPGATDNAASVAALLAAAEWLRAQPTRARDAVFLFTDGEERHLLGAELFVREDSLAARIGAVFNFDHAGRRPPLFNFEAAPGSRALQRALWTLPSFPGAPRSFSFATDVYRVLPFDTDFTVLRSLGVPGLNFGFAVDGYAYHNARDMAADVPEAALRTLARTARSLVGVFAVSGAELGGGSGRQNHAAFAPIGSRTLRLDRGAILALAAVGVLAAGLAIARALMRRRGAAARALLVPLLALPVGVGLLTGIVAALRFIKGVDQVGYAHPLPFFALLGLTGLGAVALCGTLLRCGHLSADVRLAAVLLPWAALAGLTAWSLPSSSLFFVIPLTVVSLAAVGLAARPGRTARAVAGLLLIASLAIVWGEPLATLLPFLMTTLSKSGPEPLLFWPGAFAGLAALIGSLAWALVGPLPGPAESGQGTNLRATRLRRGWFALPLALGAAAVAALATPAYDAAHPQRMHRYHLTTMDGAQEVVASTDKLTLAEKAGEWDQHPIENLARVIPGWPARARMSSVRAPLPQVRATRAADSVIVEVLLPSGTDLVYLTVEGATLTATDPPSERGRAPRVSLRRIVAGETSARFVLVGRIPSGARILVSAVTPRLTEGVNGDAMTEGGDDKFVFVDRSIAYVDVKPD